MASRAASSLASELVIQVASAALTGNRHLSNISLGVERLVEDVNARFGDPGFGRVIGTGWEDVEQSKSRESNAPERCDPMTCRAFSCGVELTRIEECRVFASALRFLAGPEASWITGQLLGVDDGQLLRRGPDLGSLFDAPTTYAYYTGSVKSSIGDTGVLRGEPVHTFGSKMLRGLPILPRCIHVCEV
jgi:hypothetical protein